MKAVVNADEIPQDTGRAKENGRLILIK